MNTAVAGKQGLRLFAKVDAVERHASLTLFSRSQRLQCL